MYVCFAAIIATGDKTCRLDQELQGTVWCFAVGTSSHRPEFSSLVWQTVRCGFWPRVRTGMPIRRTKTCTPGLLQGLCSEAVFVSFLSDILCSDVSSMAGNFDEQEA